jgi:pilus assembly protein CpaF
MRIGRAITPDAIVPGPEARVVVLTADPAFEDSVRSTFAAAIRVIVQLSRLSDGKRRVMSIAEITGLEGDIIQMQEIYKFVRTGTAPDGAVQGHFQATGVRPRFLGDLIAQGIKIPGAYFDPSQPL